MQVRASHPGRMAAAASLTFVLTLTWGLWRFGAAQVGTRYLLFVWLLIPAILVLPSPLWRGRIDLRILFLALMGLFLLAQASIQPTLEAAGYLHLATGWLSLFSSLRLTTGDRRLARFLAAVLILLGACEAFYGITQTVGGYDYIGDYFRNLGRLATGTLINRNHYAALLNLILPLGLGLLVADQTLPRSHSARRSESVARGWIILLGCSLMGLGVLMSQSRGGALSLVMTLLFMGLLLALGRRESRRGVSGFAAIIVLFLVVAMGAAFGLEALLERFGRLDNDLSRLDLYRDTLEIVGDEWAVGVGPGMYRWRYPRYQTVDPGRLYDHAHSDYLESAAEWGVLVAFLAWGLVFWRLFRSAALAVSGPRPWRRGLALGCAGALFSILIHSLVDFSLQIPAVLMVFACVLGVSWSLEPWEPEKDADRGFKGPMEGQRTSVAWIVVLSDVVLRILLLVALLTAGWQTLVRYRALEAARPNEGLAGLERAIEIDPTAPEPRFLLAMVQRDLPGAGDLERATTELEVALQLNPYSSRYWMEYSRLQELLGDEERAESAMRVAAELEPTLGKHRWRLANLLLRQGQLVPAVAEMQLAVEFEVQLAEPAIALLIKAGVDPTEIEGMLPDDRGVLLRLLRSLPRVRTQRDLGSWLLTEVWGRLLSGSSPPSVREGRSYIDHLLTSGRLDSARRSWIELLRVNGLVDLDFEAGANAVWNGGFETTLVGEPLGWRVHPTASFESRRAPGAGMDRSVALELEFKGTENIDFSHVSQQLILEPGSVYRLTAAIRSEDLSTDQGLFIEILNGDRSQVLAATESVLGTTGWRTLEASLEVPEESGLMWIRIRRWPSQQIDSRVRGKVWLDSMRLEPASS